MAKLTDVLRGFFGKDVDEANAGAKEVIKAAETKDIGGVWEALKAFIAPLVRIVESVSTGLKGIGEAGIPGQEKRDRVINTVTETLAPIVEDKTKTPDGTTPDVWSAIVKNLLVAGSTILINSLVAKYNKEGLFKHE